MARKPRIEYPGAFYHVYSRGNYRKALFLDKGTGQAFVKAVFEAAEFSNWLLHAYTLMPNHYHLVVETPEGNLSAGMQWLQGTFANRFNRNRGESGHVFQGRYKSPLLEPGNAFRRAVDYVHLNPVKAGLCSLENLHEYEFSSYRHFWNSNRPARLIRGRFLSQLAISDTWEGMGQYAKHLHFRINDDPESLLEDEVELTSSWVIGSEEFRTEIGKKFTRMEEALDWGGPEVNGLREWKWEQIVRQELRKHGMSEADLTNSPKLAPWKIAISRRLRIQTNAKNRWIAGRLNMGHPSNVSRYLKAMPKSKG